MWKLLTFVTAAVPVGITPAAAGIAMPDVGNAVLLKPRTKTSGCSLGADPDVRCSSSLRKGRS
jgi:hypothetical protein